MQPTISIVVPILNEGERLPQLLQMLERLHADEVILVDGGSTDGSDMLLSGSSFKWIRSAPGRAVQMNRGAEKCRSDILLFLHADTAITPSAVDAAKAVMNHAEVAAGRFDLSLSGRRAVFRLIESMINLRSRITKISSGDQAIFVRRQIFEALGGFPEQPLMEDIELSRRLKRAGRIACLRDKVTTSSRRWEGHGVVRTILLMWKLRFLYWLGAAPESLAQMYRHAR